MDGTLFEKGGWLYVRCIIRDWSKPEMTIHYWPTGARFMDLANRLGTDEAKTRIGMKMSYKGQGVYWDEKFQSYRLKDGAQTKPEWSENSSVPEPVQRGRKLPLRWRDGRWQKETSKGWVVA